jgi:hypothetical protein
LPPFAGFLTGADERDAPRLDGAEDAGTAFAAGALARLLAAPVVDRDDCSGTSVSPFALLGLLFCRSVAYRFSRSVIETPRTVGVIAFGLCVVRAFAILCALLADPQSG